MTTPKPRLPNRWGCRTENGKCKIHNEKSLCAHGCKHAKEHQCSGKTRTPSHDAAASTPAAAE
jgi:hypothetical protein